MASNIYTRHTVTGKTTYTRKGTQGRKPMPEELRKVKFSARVTKETFARVEQQAAAHNMTASAYADLALALFDINNVGQ
jgi:hypothetical protein